MTIPHKTISVCQNIPKLNLAILKKIQKRNSLYRRTRVSGCCCSWRRYKVLRNQIMKDLRIFKLSYFMRLSEASSTDSNRFWCLLQTIRNSPTSYHPYNQVWWFQCNRTSDAEKANVLNTFFSQCFNSSAAVLTPSDVVSMRPSEFVLTNYCVPVILYKLFRMAESCWSWWHLDSYAQSNICKCCTLSKQTFNLSIRCCQIPTEWKLANI